MAAVATGNIDAATEMFYLGADIHAENLQGTTAYDYAWNNSKMRNWLKDLGVGKDAGVSGTGRLFRGDFSRAPNIAARSQLFLFPSNPRFPH